MDRLVEPQTVSLKGGGLVTGQIRQRLVVIQHRSKLVALGGGQVALKVEHEARRTEADLQPFLFGL